MSTDPEILRANLDECIEELRGHEAAFDPHGDKTYRREHGQKKTLIQLRISQVRNALKQQNAASKTEPKDCILVTLAHEGQFHSYAAPLNLPELASQIFEVYEPPYPCVIWSCSLTRAEFSALPESIKDIP